MNAFVFLNCDISTGPATISEISNISGVSEAVRVSGVYDIVAKLSEESRQDISRSIKKIRAIANITSSLTMIESQEHSVKQMEVSQ